MRKIHDMVTMITVGALIAEIVSNGNAAALLFHETESFVWGAVYYKDWAYHVHPFTD